MLHCQYNSLISFHNLIDIIVTVYEFTLTINCSKSCWLKIIILHSYLFFTHTYKYNNLLGFLIDQKCHYLYVFCTSVKVDLSFAFNIIIRYFLISYMFRFFSRSLWCFGCEGCYCNFISKANAKFPSENIFLLLFT